MAAPAVVTTARVAGPLVFSGAAILCACGNSSQGAPGGVGSDGGGESSTGALPDGGAGGADGASAGPASVLQHHMNASRDGLYLDDTMTKARVPSLKLDPSFSPAIAGNIYAQPLYVTSGPAGRDAFLVATESNHVTAIDAAGNVVWDQTYGSPVSSGLPCGNISPLGITGTPVIDPVSRTIYFDAMTSSGSAATHVLHAVSLDTGAEEPSWPAAGLDVEMYVTGFTSKTQNQRGALTLWNGVVYVPYGGLDGDCGTYFGYVLGIPVDNPTAVTVFSVGAMFPTGSAAAKGASKGGIWAAGGIAGDGTALFVSTGNTAGNTSVWSGGEAVLRLLAGPTFTNSVENEFYPSNWAALDGADEDLGGANPVVFDLPGNPVQRLVVALGKDGYLYLLDRDSLGGMGTGLSKTAVAPQGQGGRGALNAAAAAYTTALGTYVAYRINAGPGTGCPSGGGSGSLGVARIAGNPPTATVVWCSTETGLGSPMVTKAANGDVIVWDASAQLFGYDGDTGAEVYSGTDSMGSSMHYFNTPIDAAGRLVVGTSAPGHLYVFSN